MCRQDFWSERQDVRSRSLHDPSLHFVSSPLLGGGVQAFLLKTGFEKKNVLGPRESQCRVRFGNGEIWECVPFPETVPEFDFNTGPRWVPPACATEVFRDWRE